VLLESSQRQPQAGEEESNELFGFFATGILEDRRLETGE